MPTSNLENSTTSEIKGLDFSKLELLTNPEIEEEIALRLRKIDILYDELVRAKFGTYHYYTEKIQQYQEEIKILKKQLISESGIIFVN